MDFKPSLTKVIFSLIVGTILGLIIKAYIDGRLNYCMLNENCLLVDRTVGYTYLFILGGIIVLYIIWSLIQNKK